MKICGIICEYNPFHNGHAYQLEQARRLSGVDYVVCIMSGNFVQRGEASIFEKHLRAKHAILNGADAVIELPVHFATSSAEFFAKGAIKLLNSLPAFTHLCFGAESDDAATFLTGAKILINEPSDISAELKALTASGMSYAKARAQAFSKYLPENVLTEPNNILGLEYTKALLESKSSAQIIPIKRLGAGYSDTRILENFSSATALRSKIKENQTESLQNNLPKNVFNDLKQARTVDLELLEKHAVLATPKAELAETLDCTEGLENAFKAVAEKNVQSFEDALTNSRYTTSRIKRIGLQNLLKIRKADIKSALENELYLSILATDKKNNTLLSELGKSSYPLLVKNGDHKKLSGVAKEVFQKQTFADQIYAIASKRPYCCTLPFLE